MKDNQSDKKPCWCGGLWCDRHKDQSGGEGWEQDFDDQFVQHGGVMPRHRDFGRTLAYDLKEFIRDKIESTAMRCMEMAEEGKPHLHTRTSHYPSDLRLCDALEYLKGRIKNEFGL